MSDEILVNLTPFETRVAVIEAGTVQDIHLERSADRGLLGNIYLGKVVRVLPGMEAAFVEIGEERTGFLHVSDVLGDGDSAEKPATDIASCLREGQQIAVQVTREALGDKGARLTTRLSIASRYLVYMPHGRAIAISQQIEDHDERSRLHSQLDVVRDSLELAGGLILRTAAAGVHRDELANDLRFLSRLWASIDARLQGNTQIPLRVYEDLPLYQRVIRDLVRPGLAKIRVDDQDAFEALHQFCLEVEPALLPRLEHHKGDTPLFELYAVETEMALALESRSELKSGGYLVIDQTEALTTIDVNTGAFVGRESQQETIFRTNREAAVAIASQLRIRNLGGIVIIDFIDMQSEQHRQQVLDCLESAVAGDPARVAISGVSALGLVELTRKRSRESLAELLCAPCPTCNGRGQLKSVTAVGYEILRQLLGKLKSHQGKEVMVIAAPEVVAHLQDHESARLDELSSSAGISLQFRVEAACGREHFDIILIQ